MNQFKSKEIEYYIGEIKKGIWGILLVSSIFIATGVLNVFIEDSRGKIESLTIVLFFIPAVVYFVAALAINMGKSNEIVFIALGLSYLTISFVEFQLKYTPDSYIKNFSLSGTGYVHPMSVLIEGIPALYKIFRIGLVLVFFRLAYLEIKLKRIKKRLTSVMS